MHIVPVCELSKLDIEVLPLGIPHTELVLFGVCLLAVTVLIILYGVQSQELQDNVFIDEEPT